jgi:hypothetical protein
LPAFCKALPYAPASIHQLAEQGNLLAGVTQKILWPKAKGEQRARSLKNSLGISSSIFFQSPLFALLLVVPKNPSVYSGF